MNYLRIMHGRVIDPAQGIDRVDDVWIEGEKLLGVGPRPNLVAHKTIDATGLIVCPGLIDMHVHLREPGQEEDETIATGAQAAVRGGITSVACMPNTQPAIDNQAAAEFVYLLAERAGLANVFPIGAVTKNREGQELAEIGGLVDGGAVAFTDHDAPIASADIMRRALEYCRMFDKPVLCHAEDRDLTRDGVMHEGSESMRLGLRGMPAVAEEIVLYRDLELAKITGGRLHVLHVSTAGGVALIRRAKEAGVRVTAEATPYHLLHTERALRGYDSNFKLNPPLRTQADSDALIAGLKDGVIDALVSDHSPIATEKKVRELDQSPFGVVGLETLLPLCIKALVEPGHLSWKELIAKLTCNPARILKLDNIGTLETGATADVALIDPDKMWYIDVAAFASKSRNSPYQSVPVKGRTHGVILGGIPHEFA
jgi:dihydroorotase